MVKISKPLGSVILSSEYFANLVGNITTTCFGVIGMSNSSPIEGIRSLLFGSNFPEKGVVVFERNSRLVIELHIRVVYGMNISEVTKSITHKVKYNVEEVTGLSVGSINVFVDEMEAE